jgi:alkanesulfonate monooxygenase SsuD/methylene tetrahydromethanopterin reductase-like flavin-dependent oxidoreductase (luciferase family)
VDGAEPAPELGAGDEGPFEEQAVRTITAAAATTSRAPPGRVPHVAAHRVAITTIVGDTPVRSRAGHLGSASEAGSRVGWPQGFLALQARGFSSLATIGRVAWPGFDELAALAAAAAVTSRIGLLTDVLLAPTYDAARLAKLTASVDALSAGRLTLGLGVGARPDDFPAVGRDFHARGRIFDEQLGRLHESWAGQGSALGPTPFGPATLRGRIPVLFGGDPVRAARRAARWEGGYTVGGAPAEAAEGMLAAFKGAFRQVGGTRTPRTVCLAYFGLDERDEESRRQLLAYYGYVGDRAQAIATGAARTAEQVRDRVEAYRRLEIDELVFVPSVPEVDQVDLLADLVL